MPKPGDWNKHEIKAEIVRRGVTMKELGQKYGLSGQIIRMAIGGKRLGTADQAIADFIGVPMHELWPEHYDDKGRRLVTLKRLPALAARDKKAKKLATRAVATE